MKKTRKRDFYSGIERKDNLLKNSKNKLNGITLIALVITIVVLLILAGVSIAMLTGSNGILQQTGKAKEQTEIASEKEQIQLAYTAIQGFKLNGSITSTELENEMNANGNNVSVTSFGENFIVKFRNSNRYYEINGNGNVLGPKEKIEDEFAGDITKGGKYTGADENTAYQVSCIEDLVELSIATNGGNEELNIASSNYSGKYIVLTRTLDFNSYFSYNDASTTKYKDLNGDGIEEGIYLEMTKKEENCVGFTPIGTLSATFDGQNNEIQNIYIKRSGSSALFTNVSTVKNIGVTGNITSTGGVAAGICNFTSNKINNCWNKAKITGDTGAAGIFSNPNPIVGSNASNCYNTGEIISKGVQSNAAGISTGNCNLIEKCYNMGTVTGTYYVGGIASGANGQSTIKQSYNTGDIKGLRAGGILGVGGKVISNSYNTGTIMGSSYAGGICSNTVTVFNCFNKGTLKGNFVGGIASEVSGKILNCYNCNNVLGTYSGGIVRISNNCTNMYNCFNIGNINGNPWGIPSGLISINSSNIKLVNCFSKGESKAYYGGQVYSYGTCGLVANNTGIIELENCYYVKTSHINRAIKGMEDDQTKVTALDEATEEFYEQYKDLLNTYVDEYNTKSTAEKTDTNGENLYRFKIDTETGYPVFDI